MPMIVVAAIIVVALAAVFAPQLFARLKGRAMTRIQLRDGLAWSGGKNDPVTGVWQVMIVVDQAGGVATLGVPVKPGDASYGLVAERVARTLAGSIGVTWKQH